MTARVDGNPSNALCTGEWVASKQPIIGQLWERLAEQGTTPPILPSYLWDGGRPVDDDDLWRKQRIEDDLAGDR